MSAVVHCKREPYDVYIGRPSKWGNPFSHKEGTLAQFKVATVDEAIESYERWVREQPELMEALPELRDKTLGCWCAPKPCHGDVLVRLSADSQPEANSRDEIRPGTSATTYLREALAALDKAGEQ